MKLITFILFLLSTLSFAQETYFCDESIATMPVQSGGRVKPLNVVATESFKFITNEKKPFELTPVVAFCLLSFKNFGMIPNHQELPIKIDHVEVRKFLGLGEDDKSIMSNILLGKEDEIKAEYMGQKRNNSYKKELNKMLLRIQTYQEITNGATWTFPVVENNVVTWQDIPTFVTEEKIKTLAQTYPSPFKALFEKTKADYIASPDGDHYLLEYQYFKAKPFSYAMLFVLLSLGCLVLFKNPWPARVFIFSNFAIQVFGIVMRILISHRAPITNMYETVMFSGFGAFALSLLAYAYKKQKLFLYAGLTYNLLCLMMMTFANNMLDPAIAPLVPVLRDNFWLSTHVTTIILSYAALALSWMLANFILIKTRFGNLSKQEFQEKVKTIHLSVQVGVVMLATGIILGGVWADYSWGRFWGWDPKETWSLIVLLVYMAILHGKHTKWIPPHRYVPAIAFSFLTVMMAWFGVNYILASGLHSYGFSEGGAIFLGVFFAVQIGILAVCIPKLKPAN